MRHIGHKQGVAQLADYVMHTKTQRTNYALMLSKNNLTIKPYNNLALRSHSYRHKKRGYTIVILYLSH